MSLNELVNFGGKLKALRLQKGLTQGQLAKMIDIPRTTYANYESGKREVKLDVLKRLAEVFNITLDEFLIKDFSSGDSTKDLEDLVYKIFELVPFYTFNQLEQAIEIVKNRIASGSFIVSHDKLSVLEQINLLKNHFFALDDCKKIARILATKTSWNIDYDFAMFLLNETEIESLIPLIESGLLSEENEVLNENCWQIVIDSLTLEYAIHILENHRTYEKQYDDFLKLSLNVSDQIWDIYAQIPENLKSNN